MTVVRNQDSVQSSSFASKAWLRALELTTPIAKYPERTLPVVIEEAGMRLGEAPALLSEKRCLTYRMLADRVNQYGRWALGQGFRKGDVVCLLMPNQPEYLAIWLGITSVGVVVSLLNSNLESHSLAHCIREVSPRCIITTGELIDKLTGALAVVEPSSAVWTYQADETAFPRIDLEVSSLPCESLSLAERRGTRIDDRALCIYTSGTTGMPKAANVSHARVMQWSHWFAGMMQLQPTDRMYNCLPMYHSVGGVQVPGALLAAGGAVIIREKFSASQFWNDICRWDCTLFQYIGELCRYLLHAPSSTNETKHRIRLACGNGLAPEIWDAFRDRFQIPRILEFYAATEGVVSLFNVEGERGSIGHIPVYLQHRFSPAIVAFDVERGEPARSEDGFCIRCAPRQPGEAISKIVRDPANISSRFEGYTNQEASEKRILRDVFEKGDAWIRTGDLMRKDEKGYFYFVDRIGDTFRRKGENVASSEVSEAICAFPGIKHANVYGVVVPGTEGRVGMAALVAENELDLGDLRKHLLGRLPAYARPIFLRIRGSADLTGTFKYSKTDLVKQGYDPLACEDPLFFDHPESGAFVQLDKQLFDRIQGGGIRL
jgi:fatty-acyl-CoA synthase